jgi:hypothetical protein
MSAHELLERLYADADGDRVDMLLVDLVKAAARHQPETGDADAHLGFLARLARACTHLLGGYVTTVYAGPHQRVALQHALDVIETTLEQDLSDIGAIPVEGKNHD